MLFSHATLFVPVDLKRRIFARSTAKAQPPRSRCCAPATRTRGMSDDSSPRTAASRRPRSRRDPIAADRVDRGGLLAATNAGRARMFGARQPRHRPSAAGSGDLVPAGGAAHARSSGSRAERREVTLKDVRSTSRPDDPRYFDVVVAPLFDDAAATASALRIAFADVTRSSSLQTELTHRSRSSRPRTRSCSRPTKSWRRPTRSCSPPSRSWRRPTRSCSRPTKSSRR